MSTDIISDLCERLDLLRLRNNIVFGVLDPLPRGFVPHAESLARGLLAEDQDAVHVVRALIDPAELSLTSFWLSPLGRLLFAVGGYPRETVPQGVAAAVLGCSRQWVNAMIAKGKLPPAAKDREVYYQHVRAMVKAKLESLTD
jgi:hypothetical protein